MKIEVEYFEKEDGSMPAKEYINSLEPKMRAKVFRTIAMLEQFGTELRMPYSENLGDGIFELRVKQSSNITRTLYFFFKERKAIITNALTKKQNKVPKSEIDLAKKRRQEYVSRKEKNNE